MGPIVIPGPIVFGEFISVNEVYFILHVQVLVFGCAFVTQHQKQFFLIKRFTTNANILFTSLAEDATPIKHFVTIKRNCQSIRHFDKNIWVVRAC